MFSYETKWLKQECLLLLPAVCYI